jgi:hypothetical protein
MKLKPNVAPPCVNCVVRQVIEKPEFQWFRLGCALLAPVLAMLILLLRRMRLRRWHRPISATLQQIDPGAPAGSPYSSEGIRILARQLRRPRPSWVGDLAAEMTVAASARRSGLFTPVSEIWNTVPEYLWLIERGCKRDHVGRLHRELAARLRAQWVRIECYEFESDPRRSRSTREPERSHWSNSRRDIRGIR